MTEQDSKVISTFIDRIGTDLVETGLITKSQFDQALKEKESSDEHLGEVLVRLNFITDDLLNEFLADELNIPTINLTNYDIDIAAILLIDEDIARKYRMIPLFEIENVITVAMVDPLDVFAIEHIKGITHKVVEPVLATEDELIKAIDSYWGVKSNISEFMDGLDRDDGPDEFGPGDQDEYDSQGELDERPIIKMVNSLINDAVHAGSSDIHIEPEDNRLRIRYRVDGVLRDVSSLARRYHSPIVTRIKYMTKMDIGQRRKPQDGKIHMHVGQKKIDLRVSTYPLIHGEKVVMRILDLTSVRVHLDKLGFDGDVLRKYRELATVSNGIILVTGPTGSGKTTTLYSILNEIRGEHLNITTIEDPVEYEMTGINQGEVDEKAGVTFSSSLRAMVRQDPDVILLGEIRDIETAELATRAALTGHLVFSTLHTNNAAAAVARMVDLGIEPFLVASTVRGVLAQRLVRKICEDCKMSYKPEERELRFLGLQDDGDMTFYRGEGCNKCRSTGYKGRIGVYELLVPDEEIKRLIDSKSSDSAIFDAAVRKGMKTMRDDGALKVLKGITTSEEILRVT